MTPRRPLSKRRARARRRALADASRLTRSAVRTCAPPQWLDNSQNPLTLRAYVFNVLNPLEVLNGEKLAVQEIGPFVYRDYQRKVNVSFNGVSALCARTRARRPRVGPLRALLLTHTHTHTLARSLSLSLALSLARAQNHTEVNFQLFEHFQFDRAASVADDSMLVRTLNVVFAGASWRGGGGGGGGARPR
jgi:hypothetical protein